MFKKLDWIISEESGQGMVEYGLIIALVAVLLVAALAGLQGQLQKTFETITGHLADANGN